MARKPATATVAAHATTMDPWVARVVTLSGSAVTFTDIADADYIGQTVLLIMNAAHIWTDGAVFDVQGGATYTTAAGDQVLLVATAVDAFDVTISPASGKVVNSFTSAAQTITSGGALVLAHGLGAIPNAVAVRLTCTTGESGYSIGDLLFVQSVQQSDSASDTGGVSIVPDATNLNIRFGARTNVWNMLIKNTGAGAAVTNSSWTATFMAWVI